MILKHLRVNLSKAGAFAVSLGCVTLLCAALFAGQSPRRARPAAPPSKTRPAPPAPPEAVVPFRAGERLTFRVLWSKYSVSAATLQFAVIEQRSFFGRAAWHFRAQAQTVDTVRMLYPLDDQFDSYTDAVQLASLQYEGYLHEQGQQQNNLWRMTVGEEPAPPGVTAARVLPGTCDPLGLLFALRAVDWKKTREFHAPVFDGRRLYDVVARVDDAPGQVTVPAGQFAASHITVRVSEHGRELEDTRFSLWLAQDAARTPVLVEAQVPIGAARVELTGRP
jgi:Protein of unknown function (DUF3108)